MDQTLSSLAARLAAVIDNQTSASPASSVPAMPSSTPSSPSLQSSTPPSALDAAARAAGWTVPVLEHVAQCLLTDATIVDAQYRGLTRNRVRPVLPEDVRNEVGPLLRWLDAAGVLAPPASTAEPYRHPRPLLVAGVDDLVQHLVATPYPTGV